MNIPIETLKKAQRIARKEFNRLRTTPEFSHCHESHPAAKALAYAEQQTGLYDAALTHGVDGFSEHGGCLYLNTGDAYGHTLLFRKGRFSLGNWGDIAERCR